MWAMSGEYLERRCPACGTEVDSSCCESCHSCGLRLSASRNPGQGVRSEKGDCTMGSGTRPHPGLDPAEMTVYMIAFGSAIALCLCTRGFGNGVAARLVFGVLIMVSFGGVVWSFLRLVYVLLSVGLGCRQHPDGLARVLGDAVFIIVMTFVICLGLAPLLE